MFGLALIEYAERSLYDLVLYLKEVEKEGKVFEIYNLKVQELLGIPFKLFLNKNVIDIDSTFSILNLINNTKIS